MTLVNEAEDQIAKFANLPRDIDVTKKKGIKTLIADLK